MSDEHKPYDEPFTEEQWDERRDNGGPWPEPTVTEPSHDDVQYMMREASCEAIDGCDCVEADGHCEHGMPSWPVYLGYI